MTTSPNGCTSTGPITDEHGVVWALSSEGYVLRNSVRRYLWSGTRLLFFEQKLYLTSFTDRGYALNRDTGGAVLLASTDPLMEILVPKPVISMFNVSPSSIQAGSNATLSWQTMNAKRVYLDGAQVALSGSKQVSPASTRGYRLVAQGKGPEVSANVTLNVASVAVAQTIDSFSVSPTSITAGHSATISWATSNASSVTLNGAAVSASGSQTVSPASPMGYTLVAKGSAADVSQSVSLSVSQPQPVNRAPTWQTVPGISFTSGVAASKSVKQYASDPDGDPLTFALEGSLPSSITFDPASATFNYDGTAVTSSLSVSVAVSADDGRP